MPSSPAAGSRRIAGGEALPGPGLPLLEGRYQAGRTLIYVCRNRTCGLPAASIDEAWAQLGRASSYGSSRNHPPGSSFRFNPALSP